MTPLRAWTTRVTAATALVTGLGWGGVWWLSERRLRATDAWPRIAIGRLPSDAASVREGERLARVLGCPSCHGPALSGAAFRDTRTGVEVIAPNLSRLVPTHADDELARAIRAGVRRDGRALFGMPARDFRYLADEDVRRLVAWLRTLPERPDEVTSRELTVKDRVRVVAGLALPDALTVVPTSLPAMPDEAGGRGRYLAHVACGECHGASLDGDGTRVPPLTVAVAYTEQAFARLMRTGETPGGRDLTLMDDTARERFAHLTDEEIASLYAYLRTRAGQ